MDGENEFAKQATRKMECYIFTGVPYDQGVDNGGDSVQQGYFTKLPLDQTCPPSTSEMIYDLSSLLGNPGSHLLGGLTGTEEFCVGESSSPSLPLHQNTATSTGAVRRCQKCSSNQTAMVCDNSRALYCSPDCQSADWESHKHEKRPKVISLITDRLQKYMDISPKKHVARGVLSSMVSRFDNESCKAAFNRVKVRSDCSLQEVYTQAIALLLNFLCKQLSEGTQASLVQMTQTSDTEVTPATPDSHMAQASGIAQMTQDSNINPGVVTIRIFCSEFYSQSNRDLLLPYQQTAQFSSQILQDNPQTVIMETSNGRSMVVFIPTPTCKLPFSGFQV